MFKPDKLEVKKIQNQPKKAFMAEFIVRGRCFCTDPCGKDTCPFFTDDPLEPCDFDKNHKKGEVRNMVIKPGVIRRCKVMGGDKHSLKLVDLDNKEHFEYKFNH